MNSKRLTFTVNQSDKMNTGKQNIEMNDSLTDSELEEEALEMVMSKIDTGSFVTTIKCSAPIMEDENNKVEQVELSMEEYLARVINFSEERIMTVHNWYEDKCLISKNDIIRWYATVMKNGNRKIEQVQVTVEEYLAGVANISEESIATVCSWCKDNKIIFKNDKKIHFSEIYTDSQYVVHEVQFTTGDEYILPKLDHVQGETDISGEFKASMCHWYEGLSYLPGYKHDNTFRFPVIYTDAQHTMYRGALMSLVFIKI